MLTSHLDLHEWAEKGAPPSESALTQCVLCQFRPAKSLSDSEKYRQMADHVITTHFNVSWPGLKPPVSEPPKDDKKTEDEEEDIVEVLQNHPEWRFEARSPRPVCRTLSVRLFYR